MDATPEQIAAGHAFYTKRSLALYDLAILGYFSRMAWRCPARNLVALYDKHASANHLDVGVGTGYLLDHCRFPSATPRIGLLDLNAVCLDTARLRIERYSPEVYEANVLEPIVIDAPKFDSVGMSYLLHCLPGAIAEKAVVFDHLKAVVEPGAVIFGTTLLHDGVDRNWLARTVMTRNNAHGVFSNQHDDREGLERALAEHLKNPTLDVIGCVALFSGQA